MFRLRATIGTMEIVSNNDFNQYSQRAKIWDD